MAHPLLVKAAQHLAAARAINDEFSEKEMPAEASNQMKQHLAKAREYRQRVETSAEMEDMNSWISEPEYKHDMGSGGERIAAQFGHGEALLDSEKKERSQKAFFDYVRRGLGGMNHEVKAALVEDAQGEVLVPVDFAGTILREVPRDAVIRNLAFVRPTSSNKVDVGVVNINAAGWGKLETGTVATDGLAADPADKDTIEVHDLNALVKIGVDELDDADDDLAEIIRQALGMKIAEMEDDAFANGSGTGRPQGIAVATGVTQGVAAAAGQTVTGDELKKVVYTVPVWARRNGVWLGHTSAEEKIALLKDSEGRYLLQPNSAAGEPPTLVGYRWYTVDGLPSVTTTNDAGAGTDKSVMFGDVRQGYMIADRRRLTVQRLEERFADEGKIGLLFRHRVGGAVIRPKAFAWYKL